MPWVWPDVIRFSNSGFLHLNAIPKVFTDFMDSTFVPNPFRNDGDNLEKVSYDISCTWLFVYPSTKTYV